jgi:predicted helicase
MATIHYARLAEFWRKEEKYAFLDEQRHVGNVAWQPITPDKRQTWLTEGMQEEFDNFISIGNKDTKAGVGQALFANYGCGVATCRDAWAYSFNSSSVEENMRRTIICYNDHVTRWLQLDIKPSVDDFVVTDSKQISWGRDLKKDLQRGVYGNFDKQKIRQALYRPFTKQALFFDKVFNEEVYQLPQFLPTPTVESENRLICLSDKGHREGFNAFVVNLIPDFHVLATKDRFQCFPFYTYNEDGANRRENITDWALDTFRRHYAAQSQSLNLSISKWDIFHYVYALLHHPDYRTKYAANLRRELPRIPFVEDFWGFAQAGAQLAELHVGYEQQPEYRLDFVENPDLPLDWRVERMKVSKDKRSLVYNDFLTLAGIPAEVYEYKLGNRSALDWVIDQYQVSTDKRSGIVNDPNQPDDPQAIVRLIGQVITISLETVRIVNSLPPLAVQPAQ